MRYIVIILLLFSSLHSTAQTNRLLSGPKEIGVMLGHSRTDSSTLLAVRDTTFTPLRIGTLIYRSSDSALYTAISTSAAKKWQRVGSGSATISEGDKGDITVSGGGTTWIIDNDAIVTAKVADAAITIPKINATGTPSATTFLRGDGTWQVPGGGITDGDKGDITVSGSGATWNIDAGAVGSAELATAAVTTTRIADANVTIAKISATGTPSASNFLRGDGAWDGIVEVTDGDKGDITVSGTGTVWTIDNDVVTTAKLANNAVTTAKITDGNVTAAKLGTNSVTTIKIADANVTTAKIADANVTIAKIGATGTPGSGNFLRGDGTWTDLIGLTDGDKGDITVSSSGTVWNIDAGAVGSTELATDAVTTIKIADANVTTAKVADANITIPKLSATGTPNGSTFLRGDGTWSTPPGTSYTFSTGLTNNAGTVTANLSTGIAGGQSVIGGTATGENLTLSSTTHATKGKLLFGNSAYHEATNNLSIGTATDNSFKLDINGTGRFSGVLTLDAALKAANLASDPGTPANGYIYYNTTHQFKGYRNGTMKNFLMDGDLIGLTDGDKGDITVSGSGATWNIDAGVVGSTELATDAVTTAKITNANVTTAKIADANVTIAKLSATGTPSASTFLRGDDTWATVTGLTDGDKGDITVSGGGATWNIDASTIGSTELATDAVTTTKITDANVTNAKLATDAVTTIKIADANITTAKIANGNVTLPKLSASGTASSSTFLRGDDTWATITQVTDGDKGDVIISGGGTTYTLDSRLPGVPQMLFSQVQTVAVDAGVVGSTQTTMIGNGAGSVTIPANTLGSGTVLRIKVAGTWDAPSPSVRNVVISIKIGGVTMLDALFTSFDGGNSDYGWNGYCDLIVRSVGTSGTCMTTGELYFIEPSGVTHREVNSSTTRSINTTTSNDLDVTATWDGTTSGHVIRVTTLTLERIYMPEI